MSITIRLSRTGRKNLPSYRLVVANTRDKRNGRVLEILGYYNPSMTPIQTTVDKKKVDEWIKKGALVTESAKKVVEGKYTHVAYRPKGKKGAAEEKTGTPVEAQTETKE